MTTNNITDISNQTHEILTVSQLNQQARNLLERNFHSVWIMGEISNLSRPSSGHWYFTLKDENAQIRCALFRNVTFKLRFKPDNGRQVLARARVSLYEPRGDYQLIVEHMEPAGLGALQAAFEQLKKRLEKEGLFAEKHKKSLPELPECIGVITSDSGAALRDILKVLHRRFASVPVIVYPTLVQGDKAADQITKMIKIANQRKECDVLILARGGGSLEDLWPFNEEIVARAIFASHIPIVTGIGHEVDFTIADFVADQRAPTPSAAAELVSPDGEAWLETLSEQYQQLFRRITQQFHQRKTELLYYQKRLKHPRHILQENSQRLDQIEQQLWRQIRHLLAMKQKELSATGQALSMISPLRTLERGYSIVTAHEKIIHDTTELHTGQTVNLRFSKGEANAKITNVIAMLKRIEE